MLRIAAIIPAAGRSTRMGAPKALVEVGGRTMIEGVVAPLAEAGVKQIIVVTASAIAARLPASVTLRVEIVINDDAASEMIDSVRLGLGALEAAGRLAPQDGVLVLPVDQPGIAADDVRRCMDAFMAKENRIVVATHGGRRGHPLIFPAAMAGCVNSTECDAGLNRLVELSSQRVVEVACESAAVVRDLDTPADIAQLGPNG